MDDNIKNFRKRENNKNIIINAQNALIEIEQYIQYFNNIGGAGLCHTVFAFSKKNKIDVNKQIYSCMLLRNNLDLFFNDRIVEDTDFSLQILYKKYCTLLFNHILIEKITTGKMKGGNTDTENTEEKSLIRCENLIKKYPNYFNMKKENNRWRIKPSNIWLKFKQQPYYKI